MSGLRDWLPPNPKDGPPLPRWMVQPEENTARKLAQPPAQPSRVRAKPELRELGIIMRPRNQDPVWLNKYKEHFKEASKIALERTKYLTGKTERVSEIHRIIGEVLKEKSRKPD